MLVLLGVFVGVVYASTEVPSPDSIRTPRRRSSTTPTAPPRWPGWATRTAPTSRWTRCPSPRATRCWPRRTATSTPTRASRFTGIVARRLEQPHRRLDPGWLDDHPAVREERVPENSDQTFSRKFKELFLAIKLDNNYSKDQILENYLNTIYFGRGAYGIEAAAKTYFGVPAAELTAAAGRGARRADPQPQRLRPRGEPRGAPRTAGAGCSTRWSSEGWLTPRRGRRAVYPAVLPKAGADAGHPERPRGPDRRAGRSPSCGRNGYTEEQIDAGGLRITTTVDKRYQDAAVTAVADVMDGRAGEPARRRWSRRPADRRRARLLRRRAQRARRRHDRLRPGASASRARR